MADMSLDEVFRAAIRLPVEEQEALVSRLLVARGSTERITREEIIKKSQRLREAGAFEHLESLYGKFARSEINVDADEVEAHLRSLNREWEGDFDNP